MRVYFYNCIIDFIIYKIVDGFGIFFVSCEICVCYKVEYLFISGGFGVYGD